MEDVSSLPKITDRLLKAGYTEAQLANFWGGNALRVLTAAAAAPVNGIQRGKHVRRCNTWSTDAL